MSIVAITKGAYNPDIIITIKNNNLEEGIECFSNWLSIDEQTNGEEDKKNVQLILKVFDKENDKLLLQDNLKNLEIMIKFDNGVPFCLFCNTDDCAHTGFAICAKQNLY